MEMAEFAAGRVRRRVCRRSAVMCSVVSSSWAAWLLGSARRWRQSRNNGSRRAWQISEGFYVGACSCCDLYFFSLTFERLVNDMSGHAVRRM